MTKQLNNTTIRKEADRITLLLMKKKTYKQELFTVLDSLIDPIFIYKRLDVYAYIPSMLAENYCEIITSDPLKLKIFN